MMEKEQESTKEDLPDAVSPEKVSLGCTSVKLNVDCYNWGEVTLFWRVCESKQKNEICMPLYVTES